MRGVIVVNITDLDIVIPEEKVLRIKGKEYTIPGDMPVGIALKLQRCGADGNEDKPEAIEGMVEAVLDLLAIRQEIDREELRMNLTMKQISAILEAVNAVEES